MERKNIFEKPIKLYVAIIIFLVLILIWLLTWDFGTAREILSQISFAATISSILLALVTIVYAFYQTNRMTEEENLNKNTLTQEIV